MAAEKKMTDDERRYLDQRFDDGKDRMDRMEAKLNKLLEGQADAREERAILTTQVANFHGACDEKHGSLKSRVSRMEGNQRWVVLLVMGGVLTAILAKLGIAKDT